MKKTIGILGGGQLARMMGQANKEQSLGYDLVVVEKTYPNPATPFTDRHIFGGFDDAAVIERLIEIQPEVVTIEIEHVSLDGLKTLESKGILTHPSSKTLKLIQNKWEQSQFLQDREIPVPKAVMIQNRGDLQKLLPGKYMLKQCLGSYDGRGNMPFSQVSDIDRAMKHFGDNSFFAQCWVDYAKEISVIVVSDKMGGVRTYDVIENIHQESILAYSIVPARIDDIITQNAKKIAKNIIHDLKEIGVYVVEMFVTDKGKIYVNEIAPRVHNSGHWTMDGICETSQFANHLRAVGGANVGKISRKFPVVMINVLGPPDYIGPIEIVSPQSDCFDISTHFYEKESRPGRKIGHINITAKNDSEQEDLIAFATDLKIDFNFLGS